MEIRERVLVGTSDGLHELGTRERGQLAGCEVTAPAAEAGRGWAIVDGRSLARRDPDGSWRELAVVPDPPETWLAPTPAGVLVGTAGAHLFRLEAGALVRVESLHGLAVRGGTVVLGTEGGRLDASIDGGRSFALLLKRLPPVQCLALD